MNCWNEPTNYQALRDLSGKNSIILIYYIKGVLNPNKRSKNGISEVVGILYLGSLSDLFKY